MPIAVLSPDVGHPAGIHESRWELVGSPRSPPGSPLPRVLERIRMQQDQHGLPPLAGAGMRAAAVLAISAPSLLNFR